MDKKSYDNGTDFSFVEQKVREVQTTIENAVKTSNYQELNQSITKMVNNTLKQYQKEAHRIRSAEYLLPFRLRYFRTVPDEFPVFSDS